MFLSINLNMIKLIASLCKYNYIFKSDIIIIIIITPELQSPPQLYYNTRRICTNKSYM